MIVAVARHPSVRKPCRMSSLPVSVKALHDILPIMPGGEAGRRV
jgi:hypothetical protein